MVAKQKTIVKIKVSCLESLDKIVSEIHYSLEIDPKGHTNILLN